jgi:GGDEF domain-containing protein
VAGRRLAQHLADAEVVARVGGDEFVVVLSGVDQADSALLLQRIEQAFAAEPVHAGGALCT